MYPSIAWGSTLSVDTNTSGVISVSVDSVYKVDFYKTDTSNYILFYDKAQDNSTPDQTFSILGPQIREASTIYRLAYDSNRQVTLLEDTGTRVKIRVKGGLSQSSSLTYLQDDASTNTLEVIEDYVFTPESINVYQQWDFKSGIALDNSTVEDGLSWLNLEFGDTTGTHDDTIIYGDGSTDTSTSVTGSIANTNTYFVDQGLSTYQDYFVGIGNNGWLDFSGSGTSDWYYSIDTSNDVDLLRTRQQNDNISGKYYDNWFLSFVDQTDLDTSSERESLNNSYRNPDELNDGLFAGGGWDDSVEGTDISSNDYYNQYENSYLLRADISELQYDIDGDTYIQYKPMLKYRNYRKASLPTPILLEGTTLTSGTDYNIDYKPFSTAFFDQDIVAYFPLQSVSADIGSDLTNSGCAFSTALFGFGLECNANSEDANFLIANNIDYTKGALEFWLQPASSSNDNTKRVYLNSNSGSDQFTFYKSSTNDLFFTIADGTNTFTETISSADYSWNQNDWVHIRLEWNDSITIADQQKIFINFSEPTHTDSTGDYDGSLVDTGTTMYLGNDSASGTSYANAIIDEFYIYDYNGSGSVASSKYLASGGDTNSSNEYLADNSTNFTFDFNSIDANGRGEYFYLGSDSKFSGVNLNFTTLGVQGSSVTIDWEYWNGSSWQTLTITEKESGSSKFIADGNFYYTVPNDWAKYALHNSPKLYYIRASLSSGNYSTKPIENTIYTDIVLLQYLSNISTADQTFNIPLYSPSLSFIIEAVGANTVTNAITTSVASTYNSIPFGYLGVSSPTYAAHKLSVNTNTDYGYTVYARLQYDLQGVNPANNIDPFASTGVSWTSPVVWQSPTGTSANVDTGWFGANTSDTRVPGWSDAGAKFGPVSTSDVAVMYSSGADTGTTVYVTYAIDVNQYQPTDLYSSVIEYTVVPTY